MTAGLRMRGTVLLLVVAVCGNLLAFSWSYPTAAVEFYSEQDSDGVDLPGVMIPYSDTYTDTTALVEGVQVFSAAVDTRQEPNSLYSGPLQVHAHPRDFRFLQIHLEDGVYLGFLDSRYSRWLNPELPLPRLTGQERWTRLELEEYVISDAILTKIEYSVQVVVRAPRGSVERPPWRIELRLDGEVQAGFDFRDGTRIGEGRLERVPGGNFRFTGLAALQDQSIEVAVQTPSGLWYRDTPDITWDEPAEPEGFSD